MDVRKQVVYVAGPFRGPNHWEVEQNIRRAEEVALACWRLGFPTICPHTNTRFFDGAAEDHLWLEGDIEILKRCDIVVLTPDWERSSGARAEVEFTKTYAGRDIQVYELEDFLAEFGGD